MIDAQRALEDSLRFPELSADDPRHHGPLVSIVIVTRNGRNHLRRLFPRLAGTTGYRNFEVIVVDNASRDGTVRWLDKWHEFEVRVIRNRQNRSFSEANNQAIELARGELLLALNNDIEPIHPDWLSRLVAPLVDDAGVAATAPLLIYPVREPSKRAQYRYPDLTVQHAGICFELHNGMVRGRNSEAGRDPRQPGMRATREIAALSAACLLTRTATMRALRFDEAYFYGSEDWDLSLRLAEVGKLLLVGRSVLYHYEYGTQNRIGSDRRAEYRRRNHVVFNGTWGARVRRQLLLEHLGASGALAGHASPTFVLNPPSAPVLQWLGDDLCSIGWEPWSDEDRPPVLELASHGQGELPVEPGLTTFVTTDAAIVDPPSRSSLIVRLDGRELQPLTCPTATVSVGNSFEEGPPPVTDGTAARAVIELLSSFVQRPRFAIRNCAPNRRRATLWGDTHFANSLAAAFARRGFEARMHTTDQWDMAFAHTYDVVIHLRGLRRYQTRPGAVNVLWIISHPEDVTDDELDEFDHILVASSPFAAKIAGRTSRPVAVMHQAADTTVFHPLSRDLRRSVSGIAVVANARWPARPAPRWLMELGWDFSLFGANWENFPERRHVVAGYVPNDELSDIYATADVVVADQWEYMAREGFVANRLFDVAAAGGFVMCDGGPGVHEVFGDLVPTYHTRAELDQLLRHYLDDRAERTRVSNEMMALVRSEHSFDRRVDTILDLVGGS